MKLLNNTSVEVAAGNIVLVMLEHFIGTFEWCCELVGQEVFLGTTDVEQDEVTRLVDVLSQGISGGDSFEFMESRHCFAVDRRD